MEAAKAAKVAAPPKRTAMKKQATKFKHTTYNYVDVKNIPSRGWTTATSDAVGSGFAAPLAPRQQTQSLTHHQVRKGVAACEFSSDEWIAFARV